VLAAQASITKSSAQLTSVSSDHHLDITTATWESPVTKDDSGFSDSIVLFELTVVTNTKHHFIAASLRNQDHYGPLLRDLKDSVSSVDLVTIEIGCLGHFTPEKLSLKFATYQKRLCV